MGSMTVWAKDPKVSKLLRTAKALDRATIEAIVDDLITALDARDGDPDMEDSETMDTRVDERGRRWDYKSIVQHLPDDDDDAHDCAWLEWHDRDPRTQRRGLYETTGAGLTEDDESYGDEQDGSLRSEDEFMAHPCAGPGCPVSDPGGGTEGEDIEDGDSGLFEAHRDRIRATRCDAFVHYGRTVYQLRYRAPVCRA